MRHIKHEIETEKREAAIKLKDELYRKRKDFEIELKRDRLEVDKLQAKITSRTEMLDQKEIQIDDTKRELQQKERSLLRIEDMLRANESKLKT